MHPLLYCLCRSPKVCGDRRVNWLPFSMSSWIVSVWMASSCRSHCPGSSFFRLRVCLELRLGKSRGEEDNIKKKKTIWFLILLLLHPLLFLLLCAFFCNKVNFSFTFALMNFNFLSFSKSKRRKVITFSKVEWFFYRISL